MTEKAKKFTINQVKKDNKKFSETKRVYLDNEEYYVDIFPYFSNDKIQELISDMGKTFNKIQHAGIKVPDNLTSDFIICLVLKHFSNLTFPDETKKLVQAFMELIKSDYYKQIISEYPPESIQKVFDRLYEGASIFEDAQRKQQEFKNQYQELDIQNRDEIDAIIESNSSED